MIRDEKRRILDVLLAALAHLAVDLALGPVPRHRRCVRTHVAAPLLRLIMDLRVGLLEGGGDVAGDLLALGQHCIGRCNVLLD